MDPVELKRHLDNVAADLDAGRAPSRPVFARPALVSFLAAGLLAGCEKGVALYDAPADTAAEDCTNEQDDDNDGLTDCDDQDCFDDAACADVALYAAPTE